MINETITTIILTMSIYLILEGIIIYLFKKQTIKALKKLSKNKKELMKLGLAEIIIGLILILIVSL
ncbi:hypothetical protein COU61_01015 [Candidatus Pacearchaeota archaeon CG10_big_fil_rev_8_21_14_0_10_35_13]|nr:MAG: hypothetical protein COU61_01015 [Candidatus Pacearchaeota archaeon CG10_big_fil_rev_8_21_14_0_10_35_13]